MNGKQIRCKKIIPFKQNSIASGKSNNIYLTFFWSGGNDINQNRIWKKNVQRHLACRKASGQYFPIWSSLINKC